MELIEVSGKTFEKEFIAVNKLINRGDPNFIRPLDKDIYDVFNPKKNKTFRFGEAARWLLKKTDGTLIGRIAAFTNKRYKNKGDDIAVGGIGFFDCIDDQRAADMLFDVAKHWLLQRGMQAMDGPINFGERDRWWGLLTDGFQEPLYCMNYNQPYYIRLFETYGFKTYYNQVCFGVNPRKRMSDKFHERHKQVSADPGFRVEFLRKSQLEKYAAHFTEVYNKAWALHGGLKELRKEQVLAMFRRMRPVMDVRTLAFAYYQQQPIAIFISLPDLNQWFKFLDGKFGLFQKLRFLWIKRTRPNKKLVGLVFGIVPEYQGKGIDAFMIIEVWNVLQNTSYREYEMQWIGDFNIKMINVAENFGDTFRTRQLTTYRYLFDRSREFERHPFLN